MDRTSIGATAAYNQHVFSKNNVELSAFVKGGAFFDSMNGWRPELHALAGLKVEW